MRFEKIITSISLKLVVIIIVMIIVGFIVATVTYIQDRHKIRQLSSILGKQHQQTSFDDQFEQLRSHAEQLKRENPFAPAHSGN